MEAFNASTDGIQCKFSVHICYSDYRKLYPHILKLKNCSQLALEYANRSNEEKNAYDELKLMKEYGDRSEVGLGVSDVHIDDLESPQLIRDRIVYTGQNPGRS